LTTQIDERFGKNIKSVTNWIAKFVVEHETEPSRTELLGNNDIEDYKL
jgi:hypothetical protein